ncbi:MAG: ThiF family adenylyltransferase [Candidatus Woesearchaeota archaeon]
MTIKKIYKNFEKIKDKKIIIIGAGGLGCTVAGLLARMNIRFTIVDDDIVDDTNLERQILFNKNDLLKKKVNVIKEKLKEFSTINAIDKRLNEKNIKEIIENPDLVIDCTDNIETRKIINKYCVKNNISWIYSGAVGEIGTIYLIKDNACFECINQNKDGETSCEIGVMNSIVTIIGAWTVNIALQYLIEGKSEDKIIRINLKNNEMIKINTKKNPKCKICGEI